MANKLQIKRGTAAGIPQGDLGEPLFTSDTYDLYIGKGGALGNQRFQKYIASGTSSQFLKGDGSLDSTSYTPTSRQLTINGTQYDLSADRSWSVGTVTSVAALTIGTTGTDVSSSVANGTTTPVITLNIPTASATNRGALSSTDWTTFNNKQSALTFSSPLVNTSGTISIPVATSSVNGYLSSTDWTTFNNKQNALTNPVTGTGTANQITYWTSSSQIGSLNTATYPSLTELSYVKGVTSAIQTQLNAKEPTITAGTSAQYYRGDKTFQTLNTAAVPESGSIYFTEPRVLATVLTGLNLSGGGTIAATDSILTAFGKVQNQISALVGGVFYKGTWNASTNTPTLTSSSGTKGWYYIVSVAGSTNLDGITDWKIGDWAIFNGTTWDKVDNTDAVSSVNGFTGAVNLGLGNISDVTLSSPTNTQLLRFNGTSSKWENWTPTYISANQTITLSGDVSGSGTTAITTTIGALKVTNAMLAGSIAASKLIGTDIATVGTITAGIWNGTTIAIANGGTGATTKAGAFDALSPMTTLGDVIYGGASGTGTRLAGNTTTTRQFLRQTGTGTASAAPAWDTVTKTDVGLSNVENTALSTWAGSANITTLGTITSGTWNGTTIGVSNGGTGATSFTAGRILFGNGTSAIANSSSLFWDDTNKYLGIGTSTPTSILQVSGDGTAVNLFKLQHTGTGTNGIFNISVTNTDARLLASHTTTAIPMIFYTGNAERMSISASGVVRINGLTTNGLVYTSGANGTLNAASRNFTINGTAKSFDGSANVSWTAAEIGLTSYLPLSGGTLTGKLTISPTPNSGALIDLIRTSTTYSSAIKFITSTTDNWFLGTNAVGTNLNNIYLYNYGTSSSAIDVNYANNNITFGGTITATNFSGSSSGTNTGDQTTITGNAGTATKLATARDFTINGTAKSFDGSANVSWTAAEIGLTSYLPLTGGTLTGALSGTSATFSSSVTAATLNLNMSTPFTAKFNSGLSATNAGAKTWTVTGNANEGIVIDGYSDSTGNGVRYIDFVALGHQDAINGGSEIRFLTNPNGSGTALTRMNIKRDGNVGIGTTSPSAQLHISTASANTQVRIGNNAAYDQFIYFNGNNDWSIGMDYSNSNAFVISNQSSLGTNDRVVITTGGNVGIGTTSPTSKLQINSTSAGAATVGLFLNNESNTSNTEIRLAFAANTNNDIASNRYSYISAINTSGVNGQALRFATNETGAAAVERMRITSGGNVGIGTTSPSAYGHGGTNIITEIQNSGTAANSQAHLILSTGASTNTGAIGSITFALPNSSATIKRAAVIGSDITSNSSSQVYANLNFATSDGSGAATRMTITSGGNVGIGTTSPTPFLNANSRTLAVHQSGTNPAEIAITGQNANLYLSNGNLAAYIYSTGDYPLIFGTNGSERMRITSGGNVYIGTTTGDGYRLQIVGGTQAAATFGQTYSGVAAYSQWVNSSGAFVMGLDGAAGATERMRITSGGFVGIGVTPLTQLDVRQAATGTATANVAFRDSSTNGNALQIWNGDNEARFRAVYYGTPSDQNITFWTITSAGSQGERMRITSGGALVVGNGQSSATPALGLIEGTDGSGTNIAGAELRLQGGQSTGSAAGGVISFYTSLASTSGTATNSAAARMTISGRNVLIGTQTNSTSSPRFYVAPDNANLATIGGFNFSSGSSIDQSNNNSLSSGNYWNGTSFIASQTTATIYQHAQGAIYFYTDSGLTAGNAFAPSERMKLTSNGQIEYTALAPKVTSATIAATGTQTPSLNTSDTYIYTGTSASAYTLTIANPTGTPTQGQKMIIRIKDNGTQVMTLSFGTQYRGSTDITLPTATTAGKFLYLGFIYNSTDTKWDLIAKVNNI